MMDKVRRSFVYFQNGTLASYYSFSNFKVATLGIVLGYTKDDQIIV